MPPLTPSAHQNWETTHTNVLLRYNLNVVLAGRLSVLKCHKRAILLIRGVWFSIKMKSMCGIITSYTMLKPFSVDTSQKEQDFSVPFAWFTKSVCEVALKYETRLINRVTMQVARFLQWVVSSGFQGAVSSFLWRLVEVERKQVGWLAPDLRYTCHALVTAKSVTNIIERLHDRRRHYSRQCDKQPSKRANTFSTIYLLSLTIYRNC